MRMLKYSWLVIAFFISLCLSTGLAHAQGEPTYLGEICYMMTCYACIDLLGAPPPAASRLGMLSYGPDHLVLTGESGTHGAASFDGTNIIVNLNASYVYEFVSRFSVTHMIVNPSTLMGTYTEIIIQTAPPPPTITTPGANTTGYVWFFPCQ